MTAVAHVPRLGATVLRTAARGSVLVGVAVVIGIVLLQVVNGNGSSGGGGTKASSTPNTSNSSSATTATTLVGQGRPAAQVKVFVQNASAVGQAAATRANLLRGLGYAIVGTGNVTTPQTGTMVGCKSGFTKEAATLAKNVGVATVGAYPTPPPANASSADCIVTLGK